MPRITPSRWESAVAWPSMPGPASPRRPDADRRGGGGDRRRRRAALAAGCHGRRSGRGGSRRGSSAGVGGPSRSRCGAPARGPSGSARPRSPWRRHRADDGVDGQRDVPPRHRASTSSTGSNRRRRTSTTASPFTTLPRPAGALRCRFATVNDVHFGETEAGRVGPERARSDPPRASGHDAVPGVDEPGGRRRAASPPTMSIRSRQWSPRAT